MTPKDDAHFKDYTYEVPCVLVKIVDCYAEKNSQGGDICSLFHLALFPYKIGQIHSLAQDSGQLIPGVFVTFQEQLYCLYPMTLHVMRLRRS